MPAKMPYVRLGTSGLKVSKIILGTMQYGSPAWQEWVLGEEEAIKHIKYAYDHGIQTFDTANVYSNGLSEVALGKAIKELKLPRDELVIMTKVYNPVPSDPSLNLVALGKKPVEVGIINQHGLNRKHIFDSVKASLQRLQLDYIDVLQCHRFDYNTPIEETASLQRLQLDYIDVLQCHRFDYNTPIEETMQALHDVVQAGWVRYIGMSSCYAYQFHQMQNYAITHNLTPFISMQNHYSLVYREEEREMFPTLKLFGASKRGNTDWFIGRYKNESTATIVSRVEEIAKKKGVSMAQIAIAWILAKPDVTAPIVGTTSLDNLQDILGGLEVELSDEEVKYLEEAYKPMAITGHV